MNPGEVLETAMWADGTETVEQLAKFETDIREQLAWFAENEGVIIGPLVIAVKKPGDDRVPQVPDHIAGPDVRLLVGEAKVVCRAPHFDIGESRFVDELEPNDLNRLRAITRKGYARAFPRRVRLTDRQCDTIINDLGPDAALDALRAGEADVLRVLH